MRTKSGIDRERSFGGMEKRPGVRFALAGTAFLTAYASRLAGIRLSPSRVLALGFIRGNPGCGQGALGNALGIRKAAAMSVVERLASDGFVERRGTNDRRVRALFLTEKGEKACAAAEAYASRLEAAAFDWLGSAERDRLLGTLDEIARRCDTWRDEEIMDHG